MSFVAHFPDLTRSTILLAPSGITWSLPSGYKSKFFRYSTVVPLSYLRRLGGNIFGAKLGMEPQICPKSKESTVHDAESQISTDSAYGAKQFINVFSVIQWQFDSHRASSRVLSIVANMGQCGISGQIGKNSAR